METRTHFTLTLTAQGLYGFGFYFVASLLLSLLLLLKVTRKLNCSLAPLSPFCTHRFALGTPVASRACVFVFLQAHQRPTTYFTSASAITTDGLFDGLSTYVLLWTFVYGMVHVY